MIHDLANFLKFRDFRTLYVLTRSHEWPQIAWHKDNCTKYAFYSDFHSSGQSSSISELIEYVAKVGMRGVPAICQEWKIQPNNGTMTKLLCPRHNRYGKWLSFRHNMYSQICSQLSVQWLLSVSVELRFLSTGCRLFKRKVSWIPRCRTKQHQKCASYFCSRGKNICPQDFVLCYLIAFGEGSGASFCCFWGYFEEPLWTRWEFLIKANN